MFLSKRSEFLEQLIADNDWSSIRSEFVTREGRQARIIEGSCYLPIEYKSGVVRLDRHASPLLIWPAVKYMIYRAETTSSIEGFNSWESLFHELRRRDFLEKSFSCIHPDIFQEAMISQMKFVIAELKACQKLHRSYRIIQFYIWAAEHYPELGYSPEYAKELDELVIPGNPKGAAVRSGDPEEGALHPLLEVPLVTAALERDRGSEFEHYQQRAAVALAQAFGRNSANYRALWESDLVDLLEGTDDAHYVLRLPRIKKGFKSARSDFIEEPIEDTARRFVEELINQNKYLANTVEVNGKQVGTDRSLFRLKEPNHVRLMRGEYSSAYEMYSSEFCKLLQDFAERMDLISPITQERMRLTTRRFRYTVGTIYAAMGVSRKELAYRLDHSDLQNVDVYYDIAEQMTYHLDKAAALGYAQHVNVFLGEVPIDAQQASGLIASDRNVVAHDPSMPGATVELGGCGLTDDCYKNPPFSCYLCPKFRPYRSTMHVSLLEMLIKQHNQVADATKGAIHRMDVIYAVAQVVRMCEEA